MWNIVIGVVFIVGAASGKLVLRGLDSSLGLGVVGAGLVIWGIFQLTSKKKAE
jgi:hypothetical protein